MVRTPQIFVILGEIEDDGADIVVRPGARDGGAGRHATVEAPRWQPPSGPEHALAEAYRRAVATANARNAHTMALPAILARGPWPLDDVTRIALNVLLSTPTTVREIRIVTRTPAMLERWAEALVREPNPRSHPPQR